LKHLALIDSGSQNTIISQESAQILKLKKILSRIEISGVSSTRKCTSKHKVNLQIKSEDFKQIVKVEATYVAKINEGFSSQHR